MKYDIQRYCVGVRTSEERTKTTATETAPTLGTDKLFRSGRRGVDEDAMNTEKKQGDGDGK